MSRAISQALQRAVALQRRRPMLGDAALVLLLLLPLVPPHVGDMATTSHARLFSIALTLPLLVRRRWPLGVLVLIAAVAGVQWALGVRAFGDAALLVALYGVAVTQRALVAATATVVLEVGIFAAVLRWAGSGGDGMRAFIGLSGLAVAAAVMGSSTQSRRALVESLRERAQRLETERDQQGRLSAAAERARIAREMHDIVAHNVSVMIALADGAGYAVCEDPERARIAMDATAQTGRQALTEMRRLLGVLREDEGSRDLAPQPGLAQLDALVEQVRAAGLPVSFEVTGAPETLPAGLQLAIYRIAQEALTNALKHAGADASATVSVRHRGDRLELTVTDSGGRSRPDSGTSQAQGAGLRGIAERAAVYDGMVQAGPRPSGGWQVAVTIPIASVPDPVAV
ncbi:histidine kinase [Paraconexibacter antarcticus]|uniref:histidine kinase n=1 Tax=Paraconexibacter antarcticus TaxID=2949664 RepID=A0ABY5DW79_9ACTN|nr:histidine kinase [Paraconexibacter antarcticus]UTI66263.1 histidine kinase [Paraconexibacter antarcticus]